MRTADNFAIELYLFSKGQFPVCPENYEIYTGGRHYTIINQSTIIMKRFYQLLLAAFACVVVMACNEDDAPQAGKGNQGIPPTAKVEVTMKDAFVEGTVKDTDGNPLDAVVITSGETTVTTDRNGNFSMNEIADASGRFVLKFSKSGYFPITRSGVFEKSLSIYVVMQPKSGTNTLNTTFSAEVEETMEADGMQVNIPASSLVTEDGFIYSGNVQAEMLYLSPDNENFAEMMPGGDMAAQRSDESEAMLLSYGMVEVSLIDDSGKPLQLKEGEKSKMTFPIPESMRNNPPTSIPLWYFDENAGLWIEEGAATLEGDVYVGMVNHFSWHNLDVPAERVTITGKVTDCQDRPVPRVLVTVEQTSAMTRNDGTYTVYVPENTPVPVTVKSEDYYGYTPEVTVDVAGFPGGSTVRNVDIELPCLPLIKGRVMNTAGSLVVARLYCEYSVNGVSNITEAAFTNSSTGEFSLRVPLDAAGEAVLYVEPIGGETVSREIFLNGEDLTVNIEISQIIDDDGDGVVTIKDLNGNLLAVHQLETEGAVLAMLQGSFAFTTGVQMCAEGMFMVASETYDGESNSIDDVQVALYTITDSYSADAFSSETGHVDIIKRTDNEVTFAVTAEGSYVDTAGQEYKATLVSTVTCNVGYSANARYNVTDWSSLRGGSVVPQLKVPIDMVAFITSMGLEVEALYYEGTMADVESMIRILENNGWTMLYNNETGTQYEVIYMNAMGAMVSFTFSSAGIDAPEGRTYPICVVLIV